MKKRAFQRRCHWAKAEPMAGYHDREWGVPVHEDRTLFEMLCLEGAQAGLSWEVVLRRRGSKKILQDPDIIRNRAKVESEWRAAKSDLAI